MNGSVWNCLNARWPVTGKGRIICRAGRELPEEVDAESVQLGEVLGKMDCPICSGCKDLDWMGESLRKRDRGWISIDA